MYFRFLDDRYWTFINEYGGEHYQSKPPQSITTDQSFMNYNSDAMIKRNCIFSIDTMQITYTVVGPIFSATFLMVVLGALFPRINGKVRTSIETAIRLKHPHLID